MRDEYQPLTRGSCSLFEVDMMAICYENNLSCDFLRRENRESDVYRMIKDMYIPNGLEYYHEFLDPFCMMILNGGRMNLCGNCLISLELDKEVEMRFIIRTIASHYHSIHFQSIDTNNLEDVEKNRSLINTIKEIMTKRLLNSLKIDKEGKLDQFGTKSTTSTNVPIVSPIQELMFMCTSLIERKTLTTRAECYFESDGCFHFHLKLKNLFQGIDPEPIYSFKLTLGSMKYAPKLCISTNDSYVLHRLSMYHVAANIASLSSYIHCYNLNHRGSIGLRLASLYFKTLDEESWSQYELPRESIMPMLDKQIEIKALSYNDIHPIYGLILVVAINCLRSLSSVQVLVNKCFDIYELIRKIKSVSAIRSLIVTISQRILNIRDIISFYAYWEMNSIEKRCTIKRYLKALRRIRCPDMSLIDISTIDLSCNYPQCCDLKMLHRIYDQMTCCVLKSKDNYHHDKVDYSLNSLVFKIENETILFVEEWKLLLNDEEKLVSVLERSTLFQTDIDSESTPFDIEADNKFTDDLRLKLYYLHRKITYLKCFQNSELTKIIKHLNFWHVSIEFSFLSILFWIKSKGSHHLFKFLFWIKEIESVVKQICSILDKFLPKNILNNENPYPNVRNTIIEDIYDRKISIEEIQSLIEEQCTLASLKSDLLIVPTLNKLYTFLCQYIENKHVN